MITLLGHGYIGEHIAKEFDASGINFNWLHHTDTIPEETTFIVNATGYTGVPNVDACEKEKQQTINGNVIFPLQLEQNNINTPILHISSGCVYTGYEKEFTENDAPNFDFNNGSFYSGSKALEQKLLEPYMHKSYLFRIRMPFGNESHPKNLFTKLEKYERLIDYRNSISYVPDVAKAVLHFILTRPECGVYNVCNPGSVTTKDISDALGLTKEWFTVDEFKNAVVAPRSNCVLNSDKLEKVFQMIPAKMAMLIAAKKYYEVSE